MLKISCGGVLFTIVNGKVYIVLGKERGKYYHYKGGVERGETYEEAAIREIYEETGGLVKLDRIVLDCRTVKTKNKHYILGLIEIDPTIVKRFNDKKRAGDYYSYGYSFNEKQDMRMFPLDTIDELKLPNPTIMPIQYYKKKLSSYQSYSAVLRRK